MTAVFCSGCKEHEKLAAQTKEIQERVEELKAQREEISSTVEKVKLPPAARKGPKALQGTITVQQSDVAALEARKQALEDEVSVLQKDFADYRAKNR
ncbi:hypothetical protein DES53_102904 [Roseimicrobium gellanilyticum]|uniref:Uncharacterized protein n=2 Tax=Roseimicrobium gellanilyticum TaxID=748857 RepID=A0A366HUA1_9BACT|nr:hypothetical protein DES53_102904 [Roseimicrobium gellanilyticum]